MQSRDFTYVQNVVEANLLACTAPDAAGKAFNIACGDRITLNSLLQQINSITGRNISPIYADPRPGDIKHSQADISLARKYLGYEPKTNFLNGLEQTIDWYRRSVLG